MDTTYGRRAAGGGRTARNTRRPAKRDEGQGDRRRLIQLLVSIALFLLVYIGRGVFPAQFEEWKNAIYDSVDFTAAFQEFSRAVSDGAPLGESLEALCARILGGGPEPEEPSPPADIRIPPDAVFLSQTPGAGRAYLNTHGVMAKAGAAKPADGPTQPPEAVDTQPPEAADTPPAEPTQPVLETAVAQEYA